MCLIVKWLQTSALDVKCHEGAGETGSCRLCLQVTHALHPFKPVSVEGGYLHAAACLSHLDSMDGTIGIMRELWGLGDLFFFPPHL